MIREAISSDKEQINELYRMLVPNSKKREVLGEQIDKIKEDPNNFILVYEENGAIIGTLTLNICLQALHGESPYGVVENVVIHENHRNKRIGTKLLEFVDHYCLTIDCHRVMLLSNSKRTQAHNFFENAGYNGTVSKGFKKYY
ncbi:GNAT family N-acetyltransferase [Alkalicoccobacillus gibsonii]|uniref:GNAT family N-acetyltransferase n=1 Tax=Alkalicoccobacillus gibsonii TaxID=79881 RepID=UPI00193189DC|nr:GNAT family N-acetyltransferase [Alkalicoccobacillus gibsonii]MBM0066810.1 GNAT family N-acetyltransferase [Alkalicoccobacillus gibsonii]